VSRVSIDSVYLETEPAPQWLVPDLIYCGSMIILAAAAGVGKSVFCYALANALATGSPFIGAVPPCRVLYFDEENSRGDLSAYARWTWRGLDSPPIDLIRSNLRIESLTLGSATDWALALRATAAEFKPSLMIIDTATPACRIVNENDNAEATIAAREIRLAQQAGAPGCAALVLKHLRFDASTGQVDVRGAKAWKGAVDAVWFMRHSAGRPRADGWRNTRIYPDKTRAFGLRDTLQITPHFDNGFNYRLEIQRQNKPLPQDESGQ